MYSELFNESTVYSYVEKPRGGRAYSRACPEPGVGEKDKGERNPSANGERGSVPPGPPLITGTTTGEIGDREEEGKNDGNHYG